ncbi:MAG: polyribonucleotide nucleotidyltransferase [SAR202 cluster bacterium MP-SInd-SRR3963457-G2]|nr:MAG: polyribonucleotide nucleotidyltransferase [SAR202 cluster bacterium MP-SInd-SRR3963457-G2]
MPITLERAIGREKLIIETGKLAGQAHGSVTVRYGDSIVLVTAVMSENPRSAEMDFLPLTVDFEERLYSAGKIPGSFFRREGRPGQEGILTSRLIDRSIRPLFPKGLYNDIQITVTVLSADPEHPQDILAMVGASAALSMSKIPFAGPVGSSRVAFKDGDYIVNPTYQESKDSQLSLILSSTPDAIMMIEAGSDEVSEETILECIRRANDANQETIGMINELVSRAGNTKVEAKVDTDDAQQLETRIQSIVDGRLASLLEGNPDKMVLEEGENRIEGEVLEQLGEDFTSQKIKEGFKAVLKYEVRRRILEQGIRPDGRTTAEIRPISCEVGLLPRTHGTGLFTRGITQVLSIVTLGSLSMKQVLDTVGPDDKKRFMHHYNFPSFSTGEARRVGSPGRREIGHGALAERAVLPVLPSEEDFPYTIRVVSEVLSSNGSTSMASVCGTILALMDAGVPIKKSVAGIAMGLVVGENGQQAILSDIQGVEDFLGDMDFKVAGSADGVNALQMDVKIKGLTVDMLGQALEQARVGRLHILDKMNEVMTESRDDVSDFAPKMVRLKIPVEKIGALIGPGGRIIRGISEETGTSIDVQDDGSVTIGGSDSAMLQQARAKVDSLTRELQIGDIFTGKIVRLTSFGVFVELLPGRDGLVRSGDMGDVENEAEVGQEITVMIQEIDSQGRINLSRRALFGDDGSPITPPPRQPVQSGGFDRGPRRPGGFGGGGGGGRGPQDRRPGGPGGSGRGPRPGGSPAR